MHAIADDTSGSDNCGDHQRGVFVGPRKADWLDRDGQAGRYGGVRSGGLSGNSLLFWSEPLLDDDEAWGNGVFEGLKLSAGRRIQCEDAKRVHSRHRETASALH